MVVKKKSSFLPFIRIHNPAKMPGGEGWSSQTRGQ
jgi:hypothetical protein